MQGREREREHLWFACECMRVSRCEYVLLQAYVLVCICVHTRELCGSVGASDGRHTHTHSSK